MSLLSRSPRKSWYPKEQEKENQPCHVTTFQKQRNSKEKCFQPWGKNKLPLQSLKGKEEVIDLKEKMSEGKKKEELSCMEKGNNLATMVLRKRTSSYLQLQM